MIHGAKDLSIEGDTDSFVTLSFSHIGKILYVCIPARKDED